MTVIRNNRKTKCIDCGMVLKKGEGYGYSFITSIRQIDYHYYCPTCNSNYRKRMAWPPQEIEDKK